MVKKVLKIIGLTIVFALSALVLWRVFFSASEPSQIDTVLPTDALRAAYADKGNDLRVITQQHYSSTLAEYNYGYFTVSSAAYYPDAEEYQVVFRYNDSTLEHLAEDFELGAVPPKSGDYYDLTVVVAYKDGSKQRIAPLTERVRAESMLYTFYRVAFDGISISDDVEAVYLDVYYNQAVDYGAEAYGTLCLWSYDAQDIESTLSGTDRSKLQ